MNGAKRPQIVLFGSSIVQISFSNDGWGAILTDIYARKADIVLRGYNGWNSRRAIKVLDQVFPKDADSQPSLIIVYFGGNDSMGPHSSGLGPHVPLPEYVENMRKIATHLKGLSDTTRLIFLSCPPMGNVNIGVIKSSNLSTGIVRTNELCRIYSEACVELCNAMGIKVIDLWTEIQKRENWLNCFTDGVHLSGEGSKVVVEEILKVLKNAEWKPSLHWKSMPTEFSEDSPYDFVSADGKTTLNSSNSTFHRKVQYD